MIAARRGFTTCQGWRPSYEGCRRANASHCAGEQDSLAGLPVPGIQPAACEADATQAEKATPTWAHGRVMQGARTARSGDTLGAARRTATPTSVFATYEGPPQVHKATSVLHRHMPYDSIEVLQGLTSGEDLAPCVRTCTWEVGRFRTPRDSHDGY